MFQSIWGLAAFYQVRGEQGHALELGRQLLAMADGSDDTAMMLWGHLGVAIPLHWQGDPVEAVRHFDLAVALYDPAAHRSLAYAYGQDPGIVARAYGSNAHWSYNFV